MREATGREEERGIRNRVGVPWWHSLAERGQGNSFCQGSLDGFRGCDLSKEPGERPGLGKDTSSRIGQEEGALGEQGYLFTTAIGPQ